MSTPEPNDIVRARRREGYGTVSTEHGLWMEGETIPMRYAEALAREDCDPVEEGGNIIDAPTAPEVDTEVDTAPEEEE